jgi:hypothetical protein
MPAALPALLRRLAGPKQRRRSLFETSRGEALETRILPAAVAAVSRGTLNITGDVEGSDLEIEQVGAQVTVRAVNGASLRVGGIDVVNGSLSFSGVTSLNVRLGDADDSVSVLGTLNLKNVSVNLGDGNNTLDVGAGLNVSSKLTINGGSGLDLVTLNATTGKSATINLDDGSDDLTLLGTSFSSTVNINAAAGADLITIDEASATADAVFNGNLSITTGEDNDIVSISNATTKKVTINTGDDDDQVTLDTVTINGVLSVNTSAGADDLTLLNVDATLNGTNQLNVGTGADDVIISESSFQGGVSIDLGTGIVNTLSIDDTDFRGVFNLTSRGSVGLDEIGDRINIEANASLVGDTVFHKTVKMNVGAGAEINLGTDSLNSDIDFLSSVAISGKNPTADLNVWLAATTFASLPNLNKVVRTDLPLV